MTDPINEPLLLLTVGSVVALDLANGQICRGMITGRADGWLSLLGAGGVQLINLAQVAVITVDAGPAPSARLPRPEQVSAADRPRPASKDAPQKAGSQAPGRAWHDDELKILATAFLDGQHDGELAGRFHRSRSQITSMRQAWECARGNLVEDQVNPIARTWIERWRKSLRGVAH